MSEVTPARRAARRRTRRPARTVLVGLAALAALVTSSCQGDAGTPDDPAAPTAPSSRAAAGTASDPVELTFAVFGPDAESTSFQRVVDQFNAQVSSTQVSLETFPDRRALLDELATGATPPDVYLASRRDLDQIVAEGLNTPLLELLDERGVDYGDDYSRDALLSFSTEDDLQCMPYGLAPEVVFYNTDLIDFDRMRARGLPAPSSTLRGWSFASFAAAADVATRPRRGTRGVFVPPTLRGLAPFVYSGNGSLFDDESDPTSLVLSEDGSRDALTQALGLLRNPLLTLDESQTGRRAAMQAFEDGRLGMITGTRSLTPRLRRVPGLRFDAMPMPVIGDQVTVGDITGLCIGADEPELGRTADFLVRLISAPAVAQVAREGYLVPANLTVALSPDFLQPGQMPANANIFNTSVRDLEVTPLIDRGTPLEEAVRTQVRELFTAPLLDDLDARTEQIDETSRSVLDPDYVPEGSASPTPSD